MTGPVNALTQAFVNIFNFSGRATRSEFWWAFSVLSLILMVVTAFDVWAVMQIISTEGEGALLQLGPFDMNSTVVYAITFIPLMSLSVRRLHDVGMSGFWWLLGCVPIVGWLITLVIYAMPSSSNTTVYGSPKHAAPATRGPATVKANGQPAKMDAHQRAMQGYALLFDKDKEPTPQEQAMRKAEISDYYRKNVLKPAASV